MSAALSNTNKSENINLVRATGKGFNYLNPDPMFVMTYDLNGNPLSYFGDYIWDYTAYALIPTQPSRLIFSYSASSLSQQERDLILEQKKILAAIQFSEFSPQVEIPSVRVMYNTHRTLCIIAERCKNSNNSLMYALADASTLKNKTSDFSNSRKGTARQLLLKLVGANEINFGIHFNITKTLPLFTKEKIASFQHPVVPPRILFEKITNYQEVVDDYHKFEDKIEGVESLSRLCHEYLVGYDADYHPPEGMKKANNSFQRVLIDFGLENLAIKYNIVSPINFSKFLGLVQYCSLMLIATYTGMRRSEILLLKHDCLYIKKRTYGRIRHLMGITTKLTRHRFKTSWVTCKQVVPAVQAAQSICKLAARALYVPDNLVKDLPLFISRIYFSTSVHHTRILPRAAGGYTTGGLISSEFEEMLPTVEIAPLDLEELNEISPFQDWNLDGKFAVGSNWPITCHQLRRSIAVYAAKSGLVKHSSLRRQLKHLSIEMSLYYARGSSRVISIFNPNRSHIIHDFSKKKLSELDSIIYIRDVLMRRDQVGGGHAKTLNTQGLGKDITITLADKTKTLDDFKKGKRAWRPTVVGGCTSIEGCKTVAHPTLTKCVVGQGCNQAAILPEKLEAAIGMQQKMIEVLDITSIEYRSEMAQLDDLKRVREEISA